MLASNMLHKSTRPRPVPLPPQIHPNPPHQTRLTYRMLLPRSRLPRMAPPRRSGSCTTVSSRVLTPPDPSSHSLPSSSSFPLRTPTSLNNSSPLLSYLLFKFTTSSLQIPPPLPFPLFLALLFSHPVLPPPSALTSVLLSCNPPLLVFQFRPYQWAEPRVLFHHGESWFVCVCVCGCASVGVRYLVGVGGRGTLVWGLGSGGWVARVRVVRALWGWCPMPPLACRACSLRGLRVGGEWRCATRVDECVHHLSV
ncbi:hypothetical protein BV22DRAFT_894670 [Leucogyrophana mollusca]|uniref:Uncharacterized protein n=1 Tax=Leucogyrophana mollusca TaxID=85980 RepID=A0ACB8B191_9AGAM|nr:hypothetical protein BV22DRAFT_894670 [Leucogyrophana mollusca]